MARKNEGTKKTMLVEKRESSNIELAVIAVGVPILCWIIFGW